MLDGFHQHLGLLPSHPELSWPFGLQRAGVFQASYSLSTQANIYCLRGLSSCLIHRLPALGCPRSSVSPERSILAVTRRLRWAH